MKNELDEKIDSMTEIRYEQYLIQTLEIAESELGSDIPVSTLLILLRLNSNVATPMTQITKSSGLSAAGSSRTISTLAGLPKANRKEINKPFV